MVTLKLPWPPSVNHYWRFGRGNFHISAEGRAYKLQVAGVIAQAGIRPLEGNVRVTLDAWPPDRRKRDIDNLQKATLDSLAGRSGGYGLYFDDSQIKRLEATMHDFDPERAGRVEITVSPWPGAEAAGIPVPAPHSSPTPSASRTRHSSTSFQENPRG